MPLLAAIQVTRDLHIASFRERTTVSSRESLIVRLRESTVASWTANGDHITAAIKNGPVTDAPTVELRESSYALCEGELLLTSSIYLLTIFSSHWPHWLKHLDCYHC